MRLAIVEAHPAKSPATLNDEWFVVENRGDTSFSTSGCTLATGRGGNRLRARGQLDPGFTVAPGEKVRVITGNPGKKAHGAVPDDGVRNYHLFLAEPLFAGPGTVLALTLRQLEVARATVDPKGAGGVAAEK